jgi:UrcA family protein
MLNKMMLSCAGAALLISGFAAPAAAAPAETATVSVDVTIADLDLSTRTGNERLQRRLSRAVDQVCGRDGIMPLRESSAVVECRKSVLAGVSDQVALAQAKAQQRIRLARNAR